MNPLHVKGTGDVVNSEKYESINSPIVVEFIKGYFFIGLKDVIIFPCMNSLRLLNVSYL